jgi:hypothetical protein
MTTQLRSELDSIDAVAYATFEAAMEDLCETLFDGTDGFMCSSEYMELKATGQVVVDEEVVVRIKEMTLVS